MPSSRIPHVFSTTNPWHAAHELETLTPLTAAHPHTLTCAQTSAQTSAVWLHTQDLTAMSASSAQLSPEPVSNRQFVMAAPTFRRIAALPAPVAGSAMVAAVSSRYANVQRAIQVRERPVPTIKPDQVLVKQYASSINSGDWRLLTGRPGLVKLMFPKCCCCSAKTQGADISGVVVAKGANVTKFAVGDEVVGTVDGVGAYAEYCAAPAGNLTRKPTTVSFLAAAGAVQSALTALQALRNTARIKPGQSVLVIGASGGVGSYAVELAKHHFGAARVTAVCSTSKIDMVRALGADTVLDYRSQNWWELAREGGHNAPYDIVLQTGGNAWASRSRGVLTPKGTFVCVGTSTVGTLGFIGRAIAMAWQSSSNGRQYKMHMMSNGTYGEDTVLTMRLMHEGRLTPRVGRVFNHRDVVPAFETYEHARVRGKVLFSFANADEGTASVGAGAGAGTGEATSAGLRQRSSVRSAQ